MRRKKKWMLFFSAIFCIVFFLSASVPVWAEGVVRIDANKKYKGMNASFAKGYVPSIKKNTMQLVVPFRTDDSMGGESLLIGVTFEQVENSPFYFKNYQKQVSPSKNGVYLYKCKIKLRSDRVNGQYPLHLFVLAKTEEGTVREEFTIYVEISDGKAAFSSDGELPEEGLSGSQPKEQSLPSDPKEEIIRQPKIIIAENDLKGKDVPAGSSIFWTLTAKNCSSSQPMENMKVTMLSENKDISLEKNAWYFERIEAGKEIVLSQNVTVGKKALAESVPIQLQFDYEDRKGTAYTESETVYLSVSQTQQAELVNFMMPESFYESDTNSVAFQVQNTGLAVIYNARVRLEGKGLFASEVFLGNIEAGTSLDGEMQIFAGTLNMDEQGEIADENAEKYGDVSGRVVFSFENEQGEMIEQEQAFSTAIKKPQIVELKIEEEEEQETNQWWITIIVMTFLVLLFIICWLYLRMKHYRNCANRSVH